MANQGIPLPASDERPEIAGKILPISEQHDSAKKTAEKESPRFDLGPIHLPLPKWAVQLIAAVVVLYVGYELLADPIRTLRSRYQMGISAEADMQEAQNHFFEDPVVKAESKEAGGNLRVQLYKDGCAAVMWHGSIAVSTPKPHFVRHLTTEDQQAVSPGRVSESGPEPFGFEQLTLASVLTLPTHIKRQSEPSFSRSPSSTDLRSFEHPSKPIARPEVLVAQGQCRNPHPGAFQWRYGAQNGCWVQVWRQFQDGCIHYQWFNTCSNFWDLNPDGSPKIFWTYCVH